MDNYLVIVITLIVLVLLVLRWIWASDDEGFEDMPQPTNGYLDRFFPARGDIGPYEEEKGFRRDPRYFAGYADVQRIGVEHDFCRMIESDGSDDPKKAFFACALAGTEQLSGTSYRTETVGEGFQRSRDDYMNDIQNSGRQDYCRILKSADGQFEAKCRRALDSRFGKKDIIDPNPPLRIAKLLDFYSGIMTWFRFRDDMIDYSQNLLVTRGGGIRINETPAGTPGADDPGLQFNGVDQFLRLGENASLEFGDNFAMRSMRAVSCWVYFDEFTNNAHIFDFGNGPGKDNVFLGIVGRGNPTIESNQMRKLLCGDTDTVPLPPSGQQPVYSEPYAEVPNGLFINAEGRVTTDGFTEGAPLMRPQRMMRTTAGNVNDFQCPLPEVVGRRMKPLQPPAAKMGAARTADLVYEIWDKTQRKMSFKVSNAITLKTWTHIVVTAETDDALRPDLAIYINGRRAASKPAGFLPQTNYMTHNYIGKSNWASATSKYENRDELFKGRIFDFRLYQTVMSLDKVMKTVEWGADILGIPIPKELASERTQRAGPDVVPINELPNYELIQTQSYTLGDAQQA